MIKKLTLTNFKNFRKAEVHFGPFSILVGANASGKSNIRDALRFLHGVGRGYNLAEIIGGKWGEGGQPEWSGIRGGTREICFSGEEEFKLEVEYVMNEVSAFPFRYEITVQCGLHGGSPQMRKEGIYYDKPPIPPVWEMKDYDGFPMQPQLTFSPGVAPVDDLKLGSIRFIDLDPESMRRPSVPGQLILGDRGDNLSSVLQAICEKPELKQALSHWIQELTPMDVVGFKFVPDAEGKILVYLVEEGGRKTSAKSASDGTLRFLGMLAALLGPKPARFYFLEEIDTGIHPTRLALLMDLIASTTRNRGIQVVATTHSPQVLRLIRREDLENAALVYRVKGTSEGRVKQLPDIPHLMDVIKNQDIARLHESSWMEDAMEFTEGKPQPFPLEEERK
ncbi:MAG: AAA family ATPase [Verrucomicrobiota bacterium]